MTAKPAIAVAGASSGIGAAIAQWFLDAGWEVAALGRRRARLEAWAAQAPDRALPVAADLTVAEEVDAAARELRAWRPRFEALVHSAGDFLVADISATTGREFERIWRVNVASKHLLTRALAPALANHPVPAAVVHIASQAAHEDFPDETAYISAMHAVVGLARAQDVELRGRGIRVSVVSPGLVHTELTERWFDAATLATALAPAAVAETVGHVVAVTRAGGYIPLVQHRS